MTEQPQLLEPFVGSASIIKAMELYHCLNDQVYSTRDLAISSKTVMYWDNIGLLDIKRAGENDKRRFSFMEYLWIQFVNDLREIGLGQPIIFKLKEYMLSKIELDWIVDVLKAHPEQLGKVKVKKADIDKLLSDTNLGSDAAISQFMLLVVMTIVQRRRTSSIVFLDGFTLPWISGDGNEHWSQEELYKKDTEPFVSLPITGLFTKFLCNPKTFFALPKLGLLNESEQYLMEQVHSGKYSSITINFKDTRIKSLEMVKKQDVKAKIADVLADASYQNITIKTHQGMVTKIENTIKVAFG